MSKFTYKSSGYVHKTRAFPVLAVLALIFFQVGTAAEQPSGDSLNRPPTHTQLAFVRDDQIWLVNADGTGLIQLTDTKPGVVNRDPAWSRDGQRIAFASYDMDIGLDLGIHIMDADGSNVVQLTHEGGGQPTWGPNDRTIAFSSLLKGSVGLAVIDTDSTGSQAPTILLDRPGGNAQPAWSPDGRTIAFTSDYRFWDFVSDIWVLNEAGAFSLIADPFPPNGGPTTWYYGPAWSPDGQSIAVVACPNSCFPNSLTAIVVANADGSGLREIAQAGVYSDKPTWSPDGKWIAFGSSQCSDCQSSIRFAQVDGEVEGLIVENGHSPSWRLGNGAAIDVGHAGAWYNPATSGQGLFIDINPDSQFVFLGWITYTDDDSENPNEQHWFTAAGRYHGSRAELTLYESTGGQFDGAQEETTTPVGELDLTFFECDEGAVNFRFDNGVEGSFPINRAIPNSSSLCESQSGSMTQAIAPNTGMDGLWIDVTTFGQGFLFDIHANDAGGKFILATWLTYGNNTASRQRWLTAQGLFQGSSADLVMYESSGGSFNSAKPTATVAVGNMSISFTDCNHAVLTYSLRADGKGGVRALQRAMPVGNNECEELNATR